MQVIKCFEVMGHTDTTEGRGPMKVVTRFSTRDAAVEYVKSEDYSKWCVMGYRRCDDVKNIKEATLVILDSLAEMRVAEREDLKAKALAKLTRAEREALGL